MDSEKKSLILFNKDLLNTKYGLDPITSGSSNFTEGHRLIKRQLQSFTPGHNDATDYIYSLASKN